MRATLLLATLLAFACDGGGGDGVDDSDDPPIPDGGEECGDNAPVVSAVTVTDGGIRDYEGQAYPTILIRADVTDADGDLHWYEMDLWWDTLIDGAVSPTGTPAESYGTLSEEDCSVPDTGLAMRLYLGGNPPFSTEVEFGVVVTDAGNHSSGEPVVASFTLPDEAGQYE